MTDEQVTKLREWASDWADQYDQAPTEELLRSYVGKTLSGTTEPDDDGNAKGFLAIPIVGYSVDRLYFPLDDEGASMEHVFRYSLLTAEGLQLALRAGMTLTEHED